MKLLLVRTDGNPNQRIHPVVDPPLGILSLSSAVKKEFGHSVEVRIADLRLRGQNESSFRQDLLDWRPDIVGFSSLTAEAARTKHWVGFVKDVLPQVFIIVGGPYPSATPIACLEETGADAVFRGEGESSLCKWLHSRMNGKAAIEIPGLALRDSDGNAVLTETRTTYEDINSLPIPDWEASILMITISGIPTICLLHIGDTPQY